MRSMSKSLGSNSTRIKKRPDLFVGVFVGVQDVAFVTVDEVGDGGDFAFRIGAGD